GLLISPNPHEGPPPLNGGVGVAGVGRKGRAKSSHSRVVVLLLQGLHPLVELGGGGDRGKGQRENGHATAEPSHAGHEPLLLDEYGRVGSVDFRPLEETPRRASRSVRAGDCTGLGPPLDYGSTGK